MNALRGACSPAQPDCTTSTEELALRTCISHIVFAALLAALAACGGASGRELVEQASGDLSITGTSGTTFSRHLAAGTYLLEIREDEIDLRVQVDAGESHALLSDQVPRHGNIYAFVKLPAVTELGELRGTHHRAAVKRGIL